MFVFINGDIVEREKVKISPFDHGFMYGLGLFETFRVDHGHPFLFDDHIKRLCQGLEMVNIKWNYDKNEILHYLDQLLKANGLSHAYIRLNVSAGIGDIGLQTSLYTEPTTIMFVKPLPVGVIQKKAGVVLKTKRNSPEGDVRLKSHHFFNNVLAKRELGNDPSKEGVFLNREGYIAEGIVSNIFWIKDNKVYTPSLETGILNGITREFVLALLKIRNIDYEVGFYKEEFLLDCDEAFVTNSIQEIVPLCKINDIDLGTKSSHITETLIADYSFYKNKRVWSKDDVTDYFKLEGMGMND